MLEGVQGADMQRSHNFRGTPGHQYYTMCLFVQHVIVSYLFGFYLDFV